MNPLDSSQSAAVEAPARILRIDAGPGTGKTEVLAARIAHGLTQRRYRPSQVCALTFTRAMAQDLRRRIGERIPSDLPCEACDGAGKITPRHDGDTGFDCPACAGTGRINIDGVQVGTLHALAATVIRDALLGKICGGDEVRAIGWTKDHTFGLAMPEDVADMIELAQTAIGKKKVTQKALRDGLRMVAPAKAGWPVETEARRQLYQRNLVTYDDLLTLMLAVARAKRTAPRPTGHIMLTSGETPMVYAHDASHLRDRYPAVFVDEMQDLSAAHWRILDAWNPRNLTYVGDDAQAVYSFLGKPDASEKGAHADAATVRAHFDAQSAHATLAVNYRCAPRVNDFVGKLRRALSDAGKCTAMELECGRTVSEYQGSSGATNGAGDSDRNAELDREPGRVTIYDHEWVRLGNNDGVASDMMDGVPLAVDAAMVDADLSEMRSIAILAPTNAQIDELQTALRDAGIKAERLEKPRAVWATIGGRAIVALCRIAAAGAVSEFDALAVLRAFQKTAVDPDRILRDASGSAYRLGTSLMNALVAIDGERAQLWHRSINVELAMDVFAHANISDHPMLNHAAAPFAAWCADNPGATPRDFLLWLAGSEPGRAPRDPDTVTLSTFHGAKGLEWPVVIVYGACEGSVPPQWVKRDNAADCAEWDRALYVACSRAADAVTVVCPTELRGKARHPARLLIDAGVASENPAAQRGDPE